MVTHKKRHEYLDIKMAHFKKANCTFYCILNDLINKKVIIKNQFLKDSIKGKTIANDIRFGYRKLYFKDVYYKKINVDFSKNTG